ncbi:MAG: cytochrome c biogenesis protein CcsA [Candidatus Tectomicrobia bacterium]|nr:cytochrome c biogenesis protein CcsA [Candidatus Tectomicrobia bacterium]
MMKNGQAFRTILGSASLIVTVIGLSLALLYVPPDAVQGNVQRIMYIHVPTAWVAFFSFFIVFIASLGYLWTRRMNWDLVASSSAEIGVIFTSLTLITGMIWGKPTWGTWWTWDARLTTTAILWLIYVGYLMLRSFIDIEERRARYAALVGIVGFLDVPIVYMSVIWWRTLHQPPSMIRPGGPAIAQPMLRVLLINLLAFTLLYLFFLMQRVYLERLRLEETSLTMEKELHG